MQPTSRSDELNSIAPEAAGGCVAGGALAGLLCKLDRLAGPWQNLNAAGLGLKPPLKPAQEIDAEDAYTLARAGINPLVQGPAGRARVAGSVTMARGSESHRVFTSLPVRRLCLRVVNTVDLATRWAVFEKPDRKLTARLRGQILTYLACLYELGGLATDEFVVQCDAGLTSREDHLQHGVTILLVFHPAGSPQPVSFTLQQTALGCRVFSTAFAPAST
jgi:phage tail sheath protein FI